MNKDSWVQEVYIEFFDRCFRATAYTCEKGDRAFRAFWSLLISGGVKFDRNDFKDLHEWAAGHSYLRFYSPSESHYELGVQESNMSFLLAYENYVGRKPFITKDIDYDCYRGGAYTCHGGGKTQGRLVIGASFAWEGRRITVTSFKDNVHSLIACEYQPKKAGEDYGPSKIKKRFTISVKDLQKAKKKDKDNAEN